MPMDVLIVDDSAVMRNLIRRGLRQAGVQVNESLEASDGAQALALLERHSVDLVLTDVNMPNMNGLDFVTRARALKLPKPVAILMITTEAGQATVAEAIKRGADGHLVKPFTPEQLRDRLARVLG